MRDWGKALIEAGFDVPNNRVQFNMSCPFHGPDKHPSLSVNLNLGKWICHTGCGQGSLAGLISEHLEISLLAAERLAFDDVIKDIDFFDVEEEEDDTLPIPEIEIPYDSSSVPEWIFDRGFTKASLKRWECGINVEHGSLVIPVMDENSRNVGWIERHRPASNFRYQYSTGLPKSKVLFGLPQSQTHDKNYICITEGALDSIWLDQNGFPSVALLGVFLSTRQKELLKNTGVSEIILCLDNDVAGIKATEYVSREMSQYCPISRITLEDVKDVQDVRDYTQLNQILNERTVL
jgi:DNA primase